jgi:uncharacterized membrane protein
VRPVLRHARARTAITLLSAGLIAASFAGSASAAGSTATTGPGGLPPGCTWTIHPQPLPPGYTDVNVGKSDGVSSFVGDGTGPDGLEHPLLWSGGTVTRLPSPGGVPARAMDINRHGTVLALTLDSRIRPYLVVDGRIVPLAVPAGAMNSAGYAINDAGTVVGYSLIDGVEHGIVWSARFPHGYRDLGVADADLILHGISNAGVIVGITSTDLDVDARFRAVRGTVSGGLSSLPGIDPAQDSTAHAIDGHYTIGLGHVPGAAADQTDVLWHDDTATALPATFGALAVNSHGLVAGYLGSNNNAITVWAAGTTWTLPRLSDIPLSGDGGPSDVMENGTVIGTRSDDNYNLVPVIWTCS